MKNEIILMHGIVHILDSMAGEPVLSEDEMDMSSSVCDLLKGYIGRLLEDGDVKHYGRQEEVNGRLRLVLDCTAENFVQTTQTLAQDLFEIMNANIDIPPADVVGILFRAESDPYFAFLKLNYKQVYDHSIQDGCNGIVRRRILPSAGQKLTEAFMANLETGEVWAADRRYPVNGEMRCYLSELYLGLPPKMSGKVQMKTVIRAVEQVDRKYYGDDNPERRVRVKEAIWEEIEEKGCLDVEAVKRKVFPGSPGMQADLEEKLHRYRLNNVVLQCDSDMAKKLEQQHLVTDMGIEVIFPASAKDDVQIEWDNEGGSVTIRNLQRLGVK